MPPVTDVPASPGRRDRRRRTLLFVALVAGLLLLGGVSYLLFSGDTPDAVEAEDAVAGLDREEAEPIAGETSEPVSAASADGTWTVDTELEPYDLTASTGSFVGYRIGEELANVGTTQAVGRTPAVDGSVTVAGSTVSALELTGDLRELVSDRPRRDGRVADALRVADHPTVRFAAAEDVELPAELADGERLEVQVPGTLEAAGGATDAIADVTAQRRGDVVVVTGSLEVALADLGITAPSAAIVLGVADTATIEWQLYLVRR